jgi:hypothetical protein
MARMVFRHKALEICGVADAAIQIGFQVLDGVRPLSQSVLIGSGEMDGADIRGRITSNVFTALRLLELNEEAWKAMKGPLSSSERINMCAAATKRQRRVATLLEETGLRTREISLLFRKAQAINCRMQHLAECLVKVEEDPGAYDAEDVTVVRRELDLLCDLMRETPTEVKGRVWDVERALEEYTQAKRSLGRTNRQLVIEMAQQATEWAARLEAAFDDPAIDNAEQQLDAMALERCAEAWALAARAAEECERDLAKAAECRTRAAALRARIESMKAASGDGGSGGASEGD